jgi:hypothetical protein
MTKIKDEYQRWLLEQLSRHNKLLFLGAVIWLKWCEDFHLPLPNLRAPAGWTSQIFFLVGLAGDKYYRLSDWWTDFKIRWMLWMMTVE